MHRKLLLLLAVTCLIPVVLLGAGKIRGKVTDASTGEPLIGANVTILGTTLGGVTNANGEYLILNVAAATYSLRASYVGYQAVTISNVRVNNELTTETNFKLPGEGVTVGQVVIIAERPLVNKSATNSVRIIDSDYFDKLPARGINAAITAQPGVVSQGGNIYIRGGRADEVGYRVEGVGVNDFLYGGRGLNVTAEAVEQIQVQAGGFSAEFGGANAGIVSTQLRTGNPDRWKGSLLMETDRYTSINSKALGGYSYGYSDFTANLGGPVPGLGNKLRVFGSIENTFYRDAVNLRSPFNFTGANAVVTDNILSATHPTTAQRDTLNIDLPGGNARGGSNNLWIMTGTALLDLSPIQVRLAGSYSYQNTRNTTVVGDMFNTMRLPQQLLRDGFASLRITHVLSPTTFYEASLNYVANTYKQFDPILQDDLLNYGNPAANASVGYGLRGNGLNWPTWSLFGGAFGVHEPGYLIVGNDYNTGVRYEKRSQRSWGGRVDLTTQVKTHELKVGGEYTQETIRRYAPSQVMGWYQASIDNAGNPAAYDVFRMKGTGTGSDTYGYDINGNTIDGDVIKDGGVYYLGPRKPVFAAAYVQDKIELSDIILNLGLRFDYINPDSKDAKNPGNLGFNSQDFIMDSSLIATETTSRISPRIGFSFPVSDRTQFHAQFGKFIQQTKLRDSYQSAASMAAIIKGGLFVQTPWGWGLKPTSTTQYEIGFSQQVSDNASFDVSAFYKDIQDQVTWVNVAPAPGSPGQNYGEFVNADFATSKGIEMKVTLRRTNRLSLSVNYTFADTRTTGSNTGSQAGLYSAGSVISLPHYTFPADFNQAHRGTILLDYRFAKNDGGPVLEQLGLNMFFSFNSGHAFTLVQADQPGDPTDPRFRIPLEPIGSSTTPWFFQLDARLDKTFSIGPFDLNAYIYVINLLGTDNPTDVFIRTGDPKDDGWFASAGGQSAARSNLYNSAQYVDYYRATTLGQNSGKFGPPRQIRFGLKLDY